MGQTRGLFTATAIAAAITAAVFGCTQTTDANDEAPTGVVRSAVNPAGNNGTVKIVEHGFIDDIPNNDPHVGCEFDIEFRGFDRGTDLFATYTLSGHPPSSRDFIQLTSGSVFIGDDDNMGGATDLDAVVPINLATLNLTGLMEHPEQGFHLKLEVHADGSQGNDTKYKVFWVTGCSKQCDQQTW